MLRNLLINLSKNDWMRRFVSEFGPARRAAARFVAGETLDEAVTVVKELNRRGLKAILNLVGESVTSREEARQAGQEVLALLNRIAAEELAATISVKPSHLGLAFGQDFYYETMADIVQVARRHNIVVEIDIEDSPTVADTLAVYHRLLDLFPDDGVRQAVQAYLHRAPDDIAALIERGANIRLVKGAYREPVEIAIQGKGPITAATRSLISAFFSPPARQQGAYLALGSHDPALIDHLLAEAQVKKVPQTDFEIQMLYGVRRREQQRLADLGYQVRVYVPFGRAWYPYFMRRLAERPANLFFILRAFLQR